MERYVNPPKAGQDQPHPAPCRAPLLHLSSLHHFILLLHWKSPLHEQQQRPTTAAESPALEDCRSIPPSSLCGSQDACRAGWGRLQNLQENSRDASIELRERRGRWRDSTVTTRGLDRPAGLAFPPTRPGSRRATRSPRNRLRLSRPRRPRLAPAARSPEGCAPLCPGLSCPAPPGAPAPAHRGSPHQERRRETALGHSCELGGIVKLRSGQI